MCHHFDMTRNEVKVELHLLAAVLAYCFSYSAVYNGAEPVESLAAKVGLSASKYVWFST